jgi:hypothetical protein
MTIYESDEHIITIAIAERLDEAAMVAYCEARGESPKEVTNRISLTIARRFDANEMSFDDADAVMNELWRFMVAYIFPHPDEGLWQPAYDLYDAFDRGDYNQDQSVDPVERYTRPWVKAILQRY